MNADRRILSPITATVAAGFVVAAATLGGTFAADTPAQKGDRFKVMGDNLCAGQAWPNLTSECLAWSQGETGVQHVRFVTMANSDRDNGTTTLARVRDVTATN
ncbi:hypothetical protein L1787_24940 [Acuticoccus sp. M5D2P5]|uniref:hypothetical protein n=1 Tax=Acuticoccus kalidii TaxID=2910977 RepID=UPI001F1D134E|nr:hypothetical protein [Acuticoccus kalidii]MCF3936643.1 hypothetical protein [Acuticoccus kalidii]